MTHEKPEKQFIGKLYNKTEIARRMRNMDEVDENEISEIAEIIKAAVGSGQILSIAYAGGKQPGTKRDVIILADHGYKCDVSVVDTHEERSFAYHHILAVAEGINSQILPYPEFDSSPEGMSKTSDIAREFENIQQAEWVKIKRASMPKFLLANYRLAKLQS